MTGNHSYNDLDKYAYTTLLQEYGDKGRNTKFPQEDGTTIKIRNMNDEYLNYSVFKLKNKSETTTLIKSTISAWIDILEVEQIVRRSTKIERLKNKINHAS